MARAFDPITVEIIKNEVNAIIEEMAVAVHKTGRSAMVKIGDFATAIADRNGHVIGQGASPFQVCVFMEVLQNVLGKWGNSFRPGDALVVNDPYLGMGHMPDIAIIMPVFWRGEIAAYTFAYSHQTDIGGRFPGGSATLCAESYEEGLRLPAVKLYETGKRNDALVDIIAANVRSPEDGIGDLEAKHAGAWRGCLELEKLFEKYGLEAFNASCDYLADYAEKVTRDAIRAIPDGDYVHEEPFEDDGTGRAGTEILIKGSIRVRGDSMVVDMTGSSPQVKSAMNMPLGMSRGVIFGALRAIVDADILTNSGFTRPIKIIIPPGCVLNPLFPSAVGGRSPLLFRVFDVIFRALARGIPQKIGIDGEGSESLHFHGQKADGSYATFSDSFYGGWGARPTKDGIDGVAPMRMGFYGTVPIEVMERQNPIVVEGFGFVPDTEGAGKHRGALSVYRQWRFLEAGKIMVRTNRLTTPSKGLGGGKPGVIASNVFESDGVVQKLPLFANMHLTVKSGDRLRHVISGTGGHGNPFERDPKKVLSDVQNEKICILGARERYGVVIHPETLTVDMEMTAALRATLSAGEPLARQNKPEETVETK